ncbi:hypothetical protein cypCar_00041933, partial [Cyprinus carpio]
MTPILQLTLLKKSREPHNITARSSKCCCLGATSSGSQLPSTNPGSEAYRSGAMSLDLPSDVETRAAIITLHQNGLTCKEIPTKNIAPERTIYRIIKNFKEMGSTAVKKSSGHPRVSSKCQDCLPLRSQNRVTSSPELAREWQQ